MGMVCRAMAGRADGCHGSGLSDKVANEKYINIAFLKIRLFCVKKFQL
jgi:hypothetical protein